MANTLCRMRYGVRNNYKRDLYAIFLYLKYRWTDFDQILIGVCCSSAPFFCAMYKSASKVSIHELKIKRQ
jgi:hypothetical protein